MSREVVVVSAVRTAIGTFGGSLKDIAPTDLAAQVVRESLSRAKVDGKDVGHVVFGHVVNTEPKDMYLSRVAAINGGCGEGTPAFNVNRLCGSGLQAIVNASQSILLGDADVAIGGGAENMSRGPFASLNMRWGARMGDTKMVDMVIGALHDPFQNIHMGVTAENIAGKRQEPALGHPGPWLIRLLFPGFCERHSAKTAKPLTTVVSRPGPSTLATPCESASSFPASSTR